MIPSDNPNPIAWLPNVARDVFSFLGIDAAGFHALYEKCASGETDMVTIRREHEQARIDAEQAAMLMESIAE